MSFKFRVNTVMITRMERLITRTCNLSIRTYIYDLDDVLQVNNKHLLVTVRDALLYWKLRQTVKRST
jgi:hypothetical protein